MYALDDKPTLEHIPLEQRTIKIGDVRMSETRTLWKVATIQDTPTGRYVGVIAIGRLEHGTNRLLEPLYKDAEPYLWSAQTFLLADSFVILATSISTYNYSARCWHNATISASLSNPKEQLALNPWPQMRGRKPHTAMLNCVKYTLAWC